MTDAPAALLEPGHNNPPEPTPLELAKEAISLLDIEASAWFDGAPIENESQAADVARILDAARKEKQKSDNARKAEKEPHALAAKEVDDAWRPVLADADRIAECAKAAQTKWLIRLDAEKRAAEEAARREADAKIKEAQELAAKAQGGSLEDVKARDAAIEEAKKAERAADRAAGATASAKGEGMARAVGLRTVYRTKVVDRRLLLNHIATTDPNALTAFIEDWAAKDVRAGQRVIPGVEVIEDRVAA